MDWDSVLVSDRYNRLKSNKGADLISNLPDFIIGRILSFLPTKDAIRTCVLSKRWIHLWTFITDLHFEDTECYAFGRSRKIVFEMLKFRVFVNIVLGRLNLSSIQSFTLNMSGQYRYVIAKIWISIVLKHRVKRLCIMERTISSYSLLKFQYLQELELKMHLCDIRVPTFVLFSSLAVLKLDGITFTPASSNRSKELTLKFPVLRKYETTNCTWSTLESVTLEVPLLEVISIKYVKSWSQSSKPNTSIKFCASRLAEFNYTGCILDTILLELSTGNVASANMFWCHFEETSAEEAWICFCKLLEQLNSKVERLKINWCELYRHAKASLADLPMLEMLTHLEVDSDSVSADNLLDLLQKAPILKILVCKKLHQFDKELLNSALVPDCFRSTLQVVKFRMIHGYEHELRFAKFVMKNAAVMERMTFSFPYRNLQRSKFEKFKEKILLFKGTSSSAIIEFL